MDVIVGNRGVTAGGVSPLADEDLGLLLLIRHFELALLDLFDQGKLNGTTHTCLGQEYIPVVLRPLLDERDYVFSNHRGHGHYLARYDDPAGLLAEIMGREGAICNGVGGSQHILRGTYMSTGVQGQSLPIAVGTAMHLERGGQPLLALAYIGDGTWGEGSVYEALNMAQLWRLPLVVVVENNRIAQSTPTERQMSGTIADRARAFGIRHHRITGVDVEAIRADLVPLVAETRHQNRPLVLEFDTYRLGPHSKGDDNRAPELIREAEEHDWHPVYAARFPEQFDRISAVQSRRVAEVVADVTARPLSTWEQ
ncbi:thiamine pyrophosphate-dependent dehydrogenase E1 component subunit alpha [Couchioplanes caeruleus]|uniref:Transketolase E1 alpha subunit n=2 Tax=Couchioplanes caeruleus TaxID=56438 RepID=A0A1K0FSI8_9ACTN|nr:thiamine pyrophosphate-dependent dehydrogenase E1 component subunit alpha [Couchioplanes caeruleus]OJF15765.1 Transketolase E1 alpha subunit [Couchioplanes caeruleus subsp. caeruleus]ROP31264.1 pyruvate dehydrogenase E1 component alpha subunit [Couchioplanes caeruleus]